MQPTAGAWKAHALTRCSTLGGACADDNDFGGEIIPKAAVDHKVMAYLFNGYW